MFELGGKQYKVCPNDLVFVDSRGDLEVNDMIECNRVLLLGSKDETIIGRPYVPGTSVVAAVEVSALCALATLPPSSPHESPSCLFGRS